MPHRTSPSAFAGAVLLAALLVAPALLPGLFRAAAPDSSLSLTAAALAQEETPPAGGGRTLLVGTVVNSLTLVGIGGVTVAVEPSGITVITGADGAFELELAAGSYRVTASQRESVAEEGIAFFLSAEFVGVEVVEGETTLLEVALTPILAGGDVPPPVPLAILPRRAILPTGGTQAFNASGGTGSYFWEVTTGSQSSTIGPLMVYTAPNVAGNHLVILSDTAGNVRTASVLVSNPLAVTPATATLPFGGSQRFRGLGGVQPYAWQADAGTLSDTSGESSAFTPPATSGEVGVTLSDAAGNQAQATVQVIQPLAISPTSATLDLGASTEFVVSGGTGEYSFTASAGDVSPTSGSATVTYTAPSLVSNQTLVVTDSAGNSITAAINVARGAIRVTPATANLDFNATQSFFAFRGTPPYIWSAQQGSLSLNQTTENERTTFTAPDTAGIFTITVSDSSENEAVVNVNVNLDVQVTPGTASVALEGTQEFTATGGSGSYIWSASNGQVAPTSGPTVMYTAPNVAGTANVIVTDTAGNSATATIEVAQRPRLTPATAVVGAGESVEFTVFGGRPPYIWQADAGELAATTTDEGVANEHSATSFVGAYNILITDRAGSQAQATVQVVSASVEVQTNQESFREGETLQVDVVTTGRGRADKFLIMVLPNGIFLPITGTNLIGPLNTIEPYARDATISDETMNLLTVPLPALPAGAYTFVAVLNTPGTDPLVFINHLALRARTVSVR
ncbi:MAG: hypothetical protein HYY96_05760 [Candidatus Tectomicrobia bacterium]|nr:hypothetical protein [Candidatus Tectomicrobia bacterium]